MEQNNINEILGIEDSETLGLEKLLIIDETVNFYSKPDTDDTNKMTVTKGDEFFIKKIGKHNSKNWIKVAFDKTTDGYIIEGDKIAIILPVKLNQKEVTIYQQPYSKSEQIAALKKKEAFSLLHKTFEINNKDIIWDKVKLQNGQIGFMKPNTKVVPIIQDEIIRKKYCLYIAITVQVVLFIRLLSIASSIAAADGIPFDLEYLLIILGVAILGLIGVYVQYSLYEAISTLFKSKKEKYYYPSLFAVYRNNVL